MVIDGWTEWVVSRKHRGNMDTDHTVCVQNNL